MPPTVRKKHESDCEGLVDYDGVICKSWCYSCNRCEPRREGDFLFCYECWHVFRTSKELIDMHNKVAGTNLRFAHSIFSCPKCAHDF